MKLKEICRKYDLPDKEIERFAYFTQHYFNANRTIDSFDILFENIEHFDGKKV